MNGGMFMYVAGVVMHKETKTSKKTGKPYNQVQIGWMDIEARTAGQEFVILGDEQYASVGEVGEAIQLRCKPKPVRYTENGQGRSAYDCGFWDVVTSAGGVKGGARRAA